MNCSCTGLVQLLSATRGPRTERHVLKLTPGQTCTYSDCRACSEKVILATCQSQGLICWNEATRFLTRGKISCFVVRTWEQLQFMGVLKTNSPAPPPKQILKIVVSSKEHSSFFFPQFWHKKIGKKKFQNFSKICQSKNFGILEFYFTPPFGVAKSKPSAKRSPPPWWVRWAGQMWRKLL